MNDIMITMEKRQPTDLEIIKTVWENTFGKWIADSSDINQLQIQHNIRRDICPECGGMFSTSKHLINTERINKKNPNSRILFWTFKHSCGKYLRINNQ
jgi:RNase P subunit RPR2